MIYFAQPTDGGPIKIGCSANVDLRLRQLEVHYGRPLALLATMDGGRDVERALHERFASLRFGRTEQFRPAADLLAFIERPLLVDPNPDAVEVMPGPEPPSPKTIGVRASGAWAEWLDRAARHCRTDVAKLIDAALVEYVKGRGFDELPPERIP